MAKQRKTANTQADPTLKTVPLEIQGKTYTLCFDLGSLAEAEMHFRRAGEDVNLLGALSSLSLSSVRILFPCAIRKFHPEISFAEAQAILDANMPAVFSVATMLVVTWKAAMPDASAEALTETPTQP
jgi:hypothetical protein